MRARGGIRRFVGAPAAKEFPVTETQTTTADSLPSVQVPVCCRSCRGTV
ncbi:hypothetical protein SRABI76_03481 [Microbacterium oxydans]|nr:hypothetical protein SRABI76_03481 [Microbacterium oxydans]